MNHNICDFISQYLNYTFPHIVLECVTWWLPADNRRFFQYARTHVGQQTERRRKTAAIASAPTRPVQVAHAICVTKLQIC